MILFIMYCRVYGIIMITLGCLLLTRKKVIISRQYDMIFLCTLLFGKDAINPVWTYPYLIIIAALYLSLIIISYVKMKGRYNIFNIKIETLMPAITNLLDEKGIVYEVKDNSIELTNYDNKKIKCRGFFNSTEINLREAIRLPFYGEVKDSLISKMKLIQETVFPTWGVINIMMGIIFIVAVQLIVNPIR